MDDTPKVEKQIEKWNMKWKAGFALSISRDYVL